MPIPAVPPTTSSFDGKELPPDQSAICAMGRGPADIPPVHPAVGLYRQTNWRQGDKFAKKNLSIYFDKLKKKIKIKKNSEPEREQVGPNKKKRRLGCSA